MIQQTSKLKRILYREKLNYRIENNKFVSIKKPFYSLILEVHEPCRLFLHKGILDKRETSLNFIKTRLVFCLPSKHSI